MSNFDSDSSESDNNLFPVYNHYLRMSQEQNRNRNLEIGYSSSSESDQVINLRASSSSSGSPYDVMLRNSSEESNHVSFDSSSSENSLFLPFKDKESNINASKNNSWSITKELYNREIGNYKNNKIWPNKFYQSVVAVQKLKLSKQLKGHRGCVNSLHFSETGRWLVSGSDDCNICVWDWSKGKLVFQLHTPHERNIFQTKFLSTKGNNYTIVSSSRDGLIVLSVVNDLKVIHNKIIANHLGSCNKLSVHRDQPYSVLSCGEDGIVKQIDICESALPTKVTNILHHKYNNGNVMRLYGIDINPMNSLEFIVNGDDEYVRMYDKRNLHSGPVKKFCSILPNSRQTNSDNDNNSTLSTVRRAAHITSAVYNYCGTEILASYSRDNIYLFDVNGSQDTYLHHYSGHLNRATVKGVNFYGPESDYVISGSDCGYIFIWDKKSEAIVLRKHADTKGAINVLEGHPYIPTLATSGLDKTIKIWEPLNKWQQPNKNKLELAVIRNKLGRNRLRRRRRT